MVCFFLYNAEVFRCKTGCKLTLTESVLGCIHHLHCDMFDLSWTKQAQEIKRKANRVLGDLLRNLGLCNPAVKERANTILVRPVTEYALVAWSPYTKKDIRCVEAVQRRAVRLIRLPQLQSLQ